MEKKKNLVAIKNHPPSLEGKVRGQSATAMDALEELDARLEIGQIFSPSGHLRYRSQKAHVAQKAFFLITNRTTFDLKCGSY